MKRQFLKKTLSTLLTISSVFVLSMNTGLVTAYATEGGLSAGEAAAQAALERTEPVTTVAEEEEEEGVEIPQNNTVTVNGNITKSTLDGHYYAYSIPGLAVVSPLADLQKQANFMVLEYFFVSTWDLYKYTAPLALETMEIIAKANEAELGATFQMTVSRYFSMKVYPLVNDEMQITTKVMIPTAFMGEKNSYAVVYVKSGGAYEILPDLDDEPTTITFNAHAGTGAYGIIKYLEK